MVSASVGWISDPRRRKSLTYGTSGEVLTATESDRTVSQSTYFVSGPR